MPSPIHTALVDLLEAHPEALAYLLSLAGHTPVGRLRITTGTRTKTFTLERRVDRAYVVGSSTRPSAFILAEVQLDPDDDKRLSWPLYVELARTRYRCEGALVVLTVSARVRRWIRRHVVPATGRYGCSRQLDPRVIALDEIEPALLLRPDRPYLAPLAVAARAASPDIDEIAETAVDLTVEGLPKPLADDQLDAILGMVNEALRRRLETRLMARHAFRSPLFRRLWRQAQRKARAEVKAEKAASATKAKESATKAKEKEKLLAGKAKLLAGKAKLLAGKAKLLAAKAERAEAEGEAKSILAVLEARGIPVSETIRARILGCEDTATLDAWIRRAVVASTAAAVVRAKAARPAVAPPSTSARRLPQ